MIFMLGRHNGSWSPATTLSPSITYVYLSSDRFLEERYPELADLMRNGYTPAADFTTFVVYRRNR